MKHRKKWIAPLPLVTMLAAGCGSDASDGSARSPSNASAGQASSPVPEIVGTWERVTKCADVVKAFERADIGMWIPEFVAGNHFVPGVTNVSQLEDPTEPCRGAVPRKHSHFFTDDGSFGSLDFHGEQVDDGVFEITGPDSFAISKEFPKRSRSSLRARGTRSSSIR